MNFTINERLTRSGIELAEISNCHVLLKNDSNFPWLIVVPQVSQEIEDLHHLPEERFNEIMKLTRLLSQFIDESFTPEKINVGCIGNQVRQMHLHVIGRSCNDPAWPNVVWGSKIEKKPYDNAAIQSIQNAFNSFITTAVQNA